MKTITKLETRYQSCLSHRYLTLLKLKCLVISQVWNILSTQQVGVDCYHALSSLNVIAIPVSVVHKRTHSSFRANKVAEWEVLKSGFKRNPCELARDIASISCVMKMQDITFLLQKKKKENVWVMDGKESKWWTVVCTLVWSTQFF